MLLESSLSKHLKIHLHDLASSIYLIPKNNDSVKLPSGENVTKSELCSVITSHYKRTLRILSLIRQIYDFENGGKYSIAGIIYRNLDQVDGMYQVSVCSVEQEPLSSIEGAKVDFKKMKGLDMFTNNFLTEYEATTFTKHLRQLFGSYNKKAIAKIICEDTIVTPKLYKEIYEDINVQCGGSEKRSSKGQLVKSSSDGHKYSKLLFRVTKDKPIISHDLCFDKKKISVPYSRKVRELFNKFKQDYLKNLDFVYNVVHKLVVYDFPSNKYKLRDLSYDQITSIEFEIKRCIILLFVQSMVNYFKILNHVKQIKHLTETDG